jgi:hypothetical protein
MKQIKGQYGDIRTLKKDTKYKYILKLYNIITKKTFYATNISGLSQSYYDNAKEAAIVVDKYLISKGKEPINILVKK